MNENGAKPHHTLTTDIIYLPAEVTDRLGLLQMEPGNRATSLKHADGAAIRAMRGDIVAAHVATEEGLFAFTDYEFGRALGQTDAVMRQEYLRPVVHMLMTYRAQPCVECERCHACEQQMIIGYAEGYSEVRTEAEARNLGTGNVAMTNCGDGCEYGAGNRSSTTELPKPSSKNRGGTP